MNSYDFDNAGFLTEDDYYEYADTWISCKDYFPYFGMEVFVWDEEYQTIEFGELKSYHEIYKSGKDGYEDYWSVNGNGKNLDEIKYWRFIPQSPYEKDN